MKANKLFLTVVFVTICIQMLAQPGRWQQRANYTMHIDMDVQTNRFTGKQRIEYFNNSPDKLNRLFYCLSARKQHGCAKSGIGKKIIQ